MSHTFRKLSENPTVLTLLAGVLAGIGITVSFLWYLAIIGMAFFLYALWFCTSTKARAALQGFFFGLCTGGAGVWWMWDMYPLNAPGLEASSQWILIALVWGITALIAGLTTAMAAFMLYMLRDSTLMAITAPLIFILEQEARMWLYALYSYSPESLLGPHFSQTAIGYVLAESPYLLQLAHPFGIPMLTASVVVLAVALACALRQAKMRLPEIRYTLAYAITGIVLLAPLFLSFSPHKDKNGSPFSVAVVSTLTTTSTTSLASLIEEAAHKKPSIDILILPEGKTLTGIGDAEYLSKLFGTQQTLIINARHGSETLGENTADILYDDTQNGRLGTYQKIFLMPQGEYLPSIAGFLYPLSGDVQTVAYANLTGQKLVRGDELKTVRFHDAVIGGLLCSEVISPHLYHELVTRHGANLLVNVSDQSWFHGSHLFYEKMLQIAKAHAVRERLYYLQATNSAPSFVLAPDGTLITESAWSEASVSFAEITI